MTKEVARMTNKSQNPNYKKIIAFILCVAFILIPMNAMALTSAEYQRQKAYYDAQAAAAAAAADKKKQEAQMVKDQISSINTQINKAEGAISQTDSEIASTQTKINDLESQIKVQEDNLAQEKEKMHRIVNSWYMEGDNGGLFESVLSSNSISDVTTKEQYYESIRQEISGMIDQINKLKEQLKIQKEEQDNQLAIQNGLREDQTQRKESLESNKTYKNQLLNYTNGTITDLKQQQQQAEAKSNEIRAILATIYSSGNTPKGNQLVSSIDYSWYYNQKNYSTVLSPSTLTIAEVGCFVTSMAMVATYHHKGMTPPDIVAASVFNTSGSWQRFDGSSGISVTSMSLDWGRINRELDSDYPVIVSVYTGFGSVYNADGSNHFIVIKGYSDGKYLIQDPYWTNSSYDLSDVRSMKIVRPQ